MRIRSIHPEFWRSEDVAGLAWPTRLLFIGLWSYVDDNGVGRDVEKLIAAELFPLEEDPLDTLATVSRGLQALSDGGQITRYTVDGKPLFHVTAWDKWQRIDRPGKERYSPPTCADAVIRDTLATPSRTSPETPATGEGEKGRRGEGEKNSSASADAEREFDEFWSVYPRKRDKGHAAKAYRAARKKASAEDILHALRRQLPELTSVKLEFIPYASRWLNGERWLDAQVVDLRPGEPFDESNLPPIQRSWMKQRPKP